MTSLRCGLLAFAFASSAWAGAPPSFDHTESTYRELELFARVLSHVQNNYVDQVDEEALIRGAIKGMLDTLDPHTQYIPPDVFKEVKIDTTGEFGDLGIEITRKNEQVIVVAPIDDTPAQRAGIKSGDQIIRIDDESTRSMDLTRAMQKMRGPAGKKVLLTIMREGFNAPREFALIRDYVRIASVEGALHGSFASLRLKSFQANTGASLGKELQRLRSANGGKELKGVVLDLRNNPGGLLDQAVAVADRFLPGGLVIVSTRGRTGPLVSEEKSRERNTEAKYPLVVLVNAGSASASEVVAGALKDHHRAVIIGTPTFGKGSVQTLIEMEDGSGLKLTIARYFTPSGRSIQEKGILPDFIVPDTKDGQLTRADQLRERDLKHHFKGEGEAIDPKALKVSLPPTLKPLEGSEKLGDYQLEIALGYLNGLVASEGKSTAAGSRYY